MVVIPMTTTPTPDTARWIALLAPYLTPMSDAEVRDRFSVHIRTARAIRSGRCPGVNSIHQRIAASLGINWDRYAASLPVKLKPQRRRRRISVIRRELSALPPTP